MQPGDLVLCETDGLHGPRKGCVYTVLEYDRCGIVALAEIGRMRYYAASRFRSVPKPSIAAIENVRRDTVWAKLERDARRLLRKIGE